MTVEITPKLQKTVVVETPFIDELSGMDMFNGTMCYQQNLLPYHFFPFYYYF